MIDDQIRDPKAVSRDRKRASRVVVGAETVDGTGPSAASNSH